MAHPAEASLRPYFQALCDTARRGDAREESFYDALKALVCRMAEAHAKRGVEVTTLPKRTDAGNPDFRVWDGRYRITGYIEAKLPGTNLDEVETSDQLKRYLHTFPNVVLTDFYEFRLYRDGVRIARVVAGQSFAPNTLRCPSPIGDADGLTDLFGQFLSFALPQRFTAKTLAVELAKRTRFLRDEVVALDLREQAERGSGHILGFYKAFREFLIADLKLDQFADLYAQTITYGLFAARTRSEGEFHRKLAYDRIPRTIGILRDVFQFVSLGDLPEPLKWMVDDIAEVLSVADVKHILDQFYREGRGRDPIVHFYETFLAEYDPKERERRGVYYTPEPVVGYIVRSIHALLKDRFGKADGLAAGDLTLLDPAAGTMTFMAEAARVAVTEFSGKYGDGANAAFIREHILSNWYAFELMMAPYAVGHLKMSFLLEELGYTLQDEDRFNLYLTNTLEFEEQEQTDLPGMRSLSEESRLASKVKKEQPILVILGNPPYSGHSFNMGAWIRGLINDYKQVDGKPLGERNPKWLQDDYVKFLRFAQWKVEQAGQGIVGMITNHGYLDNPTFRGMRQSLLQTFDEIHVVNLHGNSLKKETCPDGAKDENVFDIRQGVAICVMVKRRSDVDEPPTQGEQDAHPNASVRHADLWGVRQAKYDWLDRREVGNTRWSEIVPAAPLYLFTPRSRRASRYDTFPSLPAIFPVNSVGIVTARDHFVIDLDLAALKRRIATFRNKGLSDELVAKMLQLKDNRDWKLADKRRAIQTDEEWDEKFTNILYRPFDIRHIFYHREAIDFGREEVMRHMTRANVALICPRQHKFEFGALATACVGGHKTVAAFDINYYFPLYLYPPAPQPDGAPRSRGRFVHLMLFEPHEEYGGRKPNLPDWLLGALAKAYGKETSPEDVFHYIYAVLYSPAYREKYAEFLKSDFPRIPFTADADMFRRMAAIGAKLTALHLLRSPALDSAAVGFHGKGDNRVAKNRAAGRTYDARNRRVYINKEQYFDRIGAGLWAYQIGGYQVLDKWLKDRAERRLSAEDVRHYCRIVGALSETLRAQRELTKLYPSVEKGLIAIEAK